jgi:hypothetical protein
MRKKLRKDLKFLNTIVGKLIPSIAVAWGYWFFVQDGETGAMLGTIAGAIAYAALYFFNAWIVGDEEENKGEE